MKIFSSNDILSGFSHKNTNEEKVPIIMHIYNNAGSYDNADLIHVNNL